MNKKDLAKKRRKRFERAMGAGGCDRCKNLSPFLSRNSSKMNTQKGRCPSCQRLLTLELDMFDNPEIIEQFVKCLAGDKDVCTHALTIMVDGEIVREDPPCPCGKSRVELKNNLHIKPGDDREAIKHNLVTKLEGKYGAVLEHLGGQSTGLPPSGAPSAS